MYEYKLYLGNNHIGYNGIKHIHDALIENKTLNTIELGIV